MQTETVSTSKEEKLSYFPNELSEFVFTRTYPRWLEQENRRETYPETVSRYIEFVCGQRQIPERIKTLMYKHMLTMGVLPSMRAFWSAGPAAIRDNTCFYNCSFIGLDSLKSFGELLYILMQGTGVGFSVEKQFISNLPEIAELTGKKITYQIPDTTEGWADCIYEGLTHFFQGTEVEFDYSLIRPAGSRLLTKGGRASGPAPLQRLMDFTQDLCKNAAGRKLSSLECNDIACTIGEIVMAGGVRRSALISFSDPEDLDMRHAKDWKKGNFPDCRYMANNSAFWYEKPERELFDQEWKALQESGSGERGFFMFPKHKRSERKSDCRSNPCGEILLRYKIAENPWTGEGGAGQFCNLSAAVMRSYDNAKSFSEKVEVATWIGVIQSSFTHFPYLRKGWSQHCEEDRLLGVDITGHCDNPVLSTSPEIMTHFNKVARETAAEASAWLDIPMPAAVTCGKPSGNSSQVVDCASGFHPRFAPYYVRRVRVSATDPLFNLVRDAGAPVHKDNKYKDMPDELCETWVVEFPVKSPEGSMTRNDETALQQLGRYLNVMETWCGERGHNQSATIYVKDNEWGEVGDWVYSHFDEITGLSFLPYDGGNYRMAPYEEITRDQYEDMLSKFPSIDYSKLTEYEKEDKGEGSRELACMGGSCEL